jgi:sRNA-binding regulator protein Hfq
MSGIDRMISSALSTEIKKKIDSDNLKKIERELFLDSGMSIKLSIEHFDNFLKILEKNSNIDSKKFVKECIDKIIKIKKSDGKYLVEIINSDLTDLILESFGDLETRKIIFTILENEYTIPEILEESQVPKTSGYRKIENMIINGLIIESGIVLSESKKISKLQCIFQEIKLNIKKEKISVTGVLSNKMLEKSTSLSTIIDIL